MIALERVQPLQNTGELDAATLDMPARSTDDREIEDLYARYYTTVYAIVNRRLQNYADAEDIVQSVFVKLAMNLAAAQGRDVKRWLSRVAVNAFDRCIEAKTTRVGLPLHGWAGPASQCRIDVPARSRGWSRFGGDRTTASVAQARRTAVALRGINAPANRRPHG